MVYVIVLPKECKYCWHNYCATYKQHWKIFDSRFSIQMHHKYVCHSCKKYVLFISETIVGTATSRYWIVTSNKFNTKKFGPWTCLNNNLFIKRNFYKHGEDDDDDDGDDDYDDSNVEIFTIAEKPMWLGFVLLTFSARVQHSNQRAALNSAVQV